MARKARTAEEDLKVADDKEAEKISLKKEDARNRGKWRDGVRTIAEGMG